MAGDIVDEDTELDFEEQMNSWYGGDVLAVCDLESPEVCEACD